MCGQWPIYATNMGVGSMLEMLSPGSALQKAAENFGMILPHTAWQHLFFFQKCALLDCQISILISGGKGWGGGGVKFIFTHS